MNIQEAKEILTLFRPGTTDREDPHFARALALARQDAELSHWFSEHCAFQEAMRSSFRQIPVPEGLKEQILSERTVRLKSVARRKAVSLAFATVGLTLLCVLASLWLAPAKNPSFSLFQSRMARMVLRQYPRMELETSDLGQIHRHLSDKGHGDYDLPGPLAKTQGTGCAVLQWHGRPVSMICFNSGKTTTPRVPDLFLFIIERTSVSEPPPTSAPQFTTISRGMSAASWTSGNKSYVLAGLGDEKFLRERL
jgi:hypothetical protein